MDIPKSKLGLFGEGSVAIANMKCSPLMMGSLRKGQGIFPAYHMNKNHWISVLLDGTVPFETVKSLLELSFELTASKK